VPVIRSAVTRLNLSKMRSRCSSGTGGPVVT
jgi:hypothetical protein